jgi:hydroxymethylbilane synthase
MSVLRLATRRSPLALLQATYVQERLETLGVRCELVHIETQGDLRRDVSLEQLGGQGVFAVEIQTAVLQGAADVAVHSAKDLPSTTPDGLTLACVPQRLDAADVLIGRSLAGLGPGATVATGSPRRRALLLERRPDLRVVGLRGNMAARFAKVGHEGVDAGVAAAAALERLGQSELVSERLATDWFIPQVGQGSIALEGRSDDNATISVLDAINDSAAFTSLVAERSFLRELGAGCSVPAGAFATMNGTTITVGGVMVSVDGSRSVRAVVSGTDSVAIGRELAIELRDEKGGGELAGWERNS